MESENLTADGNSFLLKSISENILRVLVLSASLWILGFGALVWVGTVAGVDWFSQGSASAVDQRRLLSVWGLSSSLILIFCLLVVVIWRLSVQRGLRKKISQALGVA